MSSLLKKLLLSQGAGEGVKTEPGIEDFEFKASYGLRYAGWEPHYRGTYCRDIDVDPLLIEEGLWNAYVGTYCRDTDVDTLLIGEGLWNVIVGSYGVRA